MKLQWKSNGIAHSAKGSGGFEFVIFTGWETVLVKRVPPPPHRRVGFHGKSVVHNQKTVKNVAEGKALAQDWEEGK